MGQTFPKGCAGSDLVRLDQFGNALLQTVAGFEAGGLDLGIGHDVVALVGILSDGRFRDVEIGKLLLDLLAQLALGNVGLAQPDIVGLIFSCAQNGPGNT